MKKYKIALIGAGKIAVKHLDAIARLENAELAAISEPNEAARAACAEKYGCQAYTDYREMLKDKAIDIANIATPSGLHARMALDAIAAGKHVIVEKPMAMSLAEADAMIAAAEKNNVKIGVVYPQRHSPAVKMLKKAVAAGKFGKITHGSVTIRWNRNDEYYRQSAWRGTWKMDGGCLMNQAIHDLDLLQWLLGPAASVFAYTATNLRKIEAEDFAVAIFKFANGALANAEATTTIYPTNLEEKLCIFGETGTAVISGKGFSQIEAWRFPGEDEEAAKKLCAETKTDNNHYLIINEYLQALDAGREPAANGQEGRKALELVLGIYHSARYNREISFPLKEEFTIGVGL